MKNAPIDPKPIVENMFHINDWRGFINDKLYPLQYHTRYNSFKFSKEEGEVRLRCKRLPQSIQYGPPSGLKLLKSGFNLGTPIGSSDFRVDSLDLDSLKRYIENKFSNLPLEERLEVISSWTRRFKILQDLPKRKEGLEKISLRDLPNQVEYSTRPLPENAITSEGACIVGEEFPEDEPLEGHVEEILPGMDVAVYTETRRGRPWVGRALSIDMESNTFKIRWFMKATGTRNKFVSMSSSDDVSTSIQSLESVMFWGFTDDRNEDSFTISSVMMDALRIEYENLDK